MLFQSQAKMMNLRGRHGLVRAAMIRISAINGIHRPLAAGTWVNHLEQLSVQVGGESEHVQTLSEISLHIGHLYIWILAATVNHLGQHSGGRWRLTEYVQTHYERKFIWPELITLGNGQHGACGERWGLNVYKHTMKECRSNWELGDIGLI